MIVLLKTNCLPQEEFFYPPFSRILKLTVWDKDEAGGLALQKGSAVFTAITIRRKITRCTGIRSVPALVAKVRDLFRFNI